jgi:hypothetical protein
MSVVDQIRLGTLVFEPKEFRGTEVTLDVRRASPSDDPEHAGEEVFTQVGTLKVPIPDWESLQVVNVQLAAYIATFATPNGHTEGVPSAAS